MSVITHPLSIRIGQWIAGRRGPESGAVLLDRRRVYILPTNAGLLFGAAMVVLLIGSINYSLQLGYMIKPAVEAAGVKDLRHQDHIGHRDRVTEHVTAAATFRQHTRLECRESLLYPVPVPGVFLVFARLQLPHQIAQHSQVVEGMNFAGNRQRKRAHVGARHRLGRQ